MRLISLFALALVLAAGQTARCDDPKDVAALEGTWLPSAAELGGKPLPEAVRKSIKLTIKGGKYAVTVGKNPDCGTVKIDAAAKPKAIDVTGTEGPNKGKTIPAIYELDGDTLKICYDLSGKSRPTEFESTEGNQLFLVTYRREKP